MPLLGKGFRRTRPGCWLINDLVSVKGVPRLAVLVVGKKSVGQIKKNMAKDNVMSGVSSIKSQGLREEAIPSTAG